MRFVKWLCVCALFLPLAATVGCGDSKDSAPVPHVKADTPAGTDAAGGKGRPRGGGKAAPPRLDE